jgi:hypothetical protein
MMPSRRRSGSPRVYYGSVFLPDKAIDCIDEAQRRPPETMELRTTRTGTPFETVRKERGCRGCPEFESCSLRDEDECFGELEAPGELCSIHEPGGACGRRDEMPEVSEWTESPSCG